MNLTNLFNSINPREVLTNLPDVVLVIDNDGRIVWANDKASVVFETNKSNLKGLLFNDIVSNGMELAQRSFSRRNSVVTGAFTIEGKEFFIEMNAKKYIDQYFITIRDITAMTNVLANAEKTGRLNKEKNIMLVKLANEFKSPIQSAVGFSQALLDGLGGEINDKQSKYVKIINKNSTELLYFMEKFLDFAQAESTLFDPENGQSFDIINMLKILIKTNDNNLSSKKLTVDLNFEELQNKTVGYDENCFKTALQNIFDIIIKSVDNGTITIKLDHPELEALEENKIRVSSDTEATSFIRITITDTGMGFSASELDGIFEPYTQLDKPNKKSVVRSLALGTSHLIIKRLGGNLNLSSEVMKGSTYTIIIPASKEN